MRFSPPGDALNRTFLAMILCAASAAAQDGDQNVVQDAIGIELVRIPAGEFPMGSPADEPGRRPDETLRDVRITRPFFLGRTEVTRGQYRAFVEATGYVTEPERPGGTGGYGVDPQTLALSGLDPQFSWRYAGFDQTDDHPVINVNWNDAQEFCAWCSKVTGRRYRLPSEAEWEYACRAGQTGVDPFSTDPEQLVKVGNTTDSTLKPVYPERNSLQGSDGRLFTAPVASYAPNAWGLHDMRGNVWEWCADWYGEIPPGPAVDPTGPPEGQARVIKGGDWYHDWVFARAASRYPIPPSLPRRHGGFRVAVDVDD